MNVKKTSYTDIIVYTTAVVVIILLYQAHYILYSTLVILLVLALGSFALYNLRFWLKRLFKKKY